MKLTTMRFGEIEIDQSSIIAFPQGIPGFEEDKRFVVLRPDQDIPFSFLQSVDHGEISFLITNPFWFYKDYEFDLPENEQVKLKVGQKEDLEIWSIVTIKDDINQATLNLQAPVIINDKEKLGMQVILHDTNYQTKHKLLRQNGA